MTTIWAGLALGALYVLLAIGYNLIYIGAGVFHFAQAQMMMVGTFAAYVGAVSLGAPLWTVPLIGAAAGFVIGLLAYLISIKPAADRPGQAVLVTTLAAAVVIDGTATIIFGTVPRGVPFWGRDTPYTVLGGRVSLAQLVTIALAVIVALIIWQVKTRTLIGMSATAASEDRVAAQLRGVHVGRVAILSVAFAGAFAGAIGLVVAQQTTAVPTVGGLLAVKAFVVLAIGGFGSMPGAVIGGLLVGLTDALTARYIGGQYSQVLLFAVLVAVLLLRPSGLFIQHRVRTV